MDSIYVLIKDSLLEESIILDHAHNFDTENLVVTLVEIIDKENLLSEQKNNRPNSIMESKHPDYKYTYPLFKEVKCKEKELLKYTNGTTTYRIEQL